MQAAHTLTVCPSPSLFLSLAPTHRHTHTHLYIHTEVERNKVRLLKYCVSAKYLALRYWHIHSTTFQRENIVR